MGRGALSHFVFFFNFLSRLSSHHPALLLTHGSSRIDPSPVSKSTQSEIQQLPGPSNSVLVLSMVADKLLVASFLPNYAKGFDRCDPRSIVEVANAWQTTAF
jgi:hypothetical protein